ncbi:MarR family winged helix-turn-helix transcriptional regulator [Magnetospirillum molischianum]|uniref:MarR family winged helix-turn-helix transcriptional regulator n=1 Tax=Magnetospirillum molischianum TaxID=1083 RepID=UPI00058C3476|nr:MarR family transcriptional regulator [Magnetospirillum molischianum]
MAKRSPPLARLDFGYRLVILARRWRAAIDARLHAAGLTDATWRPLIYLHRMGDGTRQKELAASLGLDCSAVVRLLDLLTARGLVERREDPADKRAKTLHLTDEGRSLITTVTDLLIPFEATLLDGIDDSAIVTLLDSFDRIETRLDAARLDGQTEEREA